jgi:hypothetical protein
MTAANAEELAQCVYVDKIGGLAYYRSEDTMHENPRFVWPISDQSDPSVSARRFRYEQVFKAAFAYRPTVWTARVLDEQPTSILVQFEDATGKCYDPPIRFWGMCEQKDVADLTTFLPWE